MEKVNNLSKNIDTVRIEALLEQQAAFKTELEMQGKDNKALWKQFTTLQKEVFELRAQVFHDV